MKFLCWYEDDVEEHGRTIEATYPEYAAEKYIEENEDSDSIEWSIEVGDRVMVRCPDGNVKRYRVRGEAEVTYSATEEKSDE